MFGVPFIRNWAKSDIVRSTICLQRDTIHVFSRKRPNQWRCRKILHSTPCVCTFVCTKNSYGTSSAQASQLSAKKHSYIKLQKPIQQ